MAAAAAVIRFGSICAYLTTNVRITDLLLKRGFVSDLAKLLRYKSTDGRLSSHHGGTVEVDEMKILLFKTNCG